MTKESKTYQIRYNTVSKNDTERWRLIENGNEILISDIVINGLTYTTKDWLKDINDYKWHISCVGYCNIKNNVAYITTNKDESVLTRHILKTITYRLLATLITITTALLLGLPLTVSALFGAGELIVKPFVYFLHERIWYKKIHIKKD
jgi:uncharacterized membrane protein